jgi:4-amino-4-deoxy-L-arabinose transferase-like glycosyltransferase
MALAFQGTRGLYEPTEGRYAEVAREMRESGSYLEPTLAHEPHWTKPPLTYWAIAGGLAIAGNNPWGVRAYDVLAFSLTVLAVAAIGTTLWNPRAGWFAGLVYLSSPYPALSAAAATADTLLALWTTLAVLAYVRAWKHAPSDGWTRLMWMMFGLGFFTKGPPALLPLIALLVFHWIARRPFRLADPVGVVLGVAAGLWWYGLMVIRHHELGAYFIGREVVARSVSNDFHRNGQWYGAIAIYAPVLVLGQGAWLVDGIRMAWRRRLYAPNNLFAQLRARGTAGSLLLCWLLLPLAVFALSRSRLPLYVLPLYAPVALATARGLDTAAGASRRRAMAIALASVALLVGFKAVAAYRLSDRDATRVYHEAVRAAGRNARFALFLEPAFYGFQFHAGPEMERISMAGTEPWADQSLDRVLASRTPGRPQAIVTDPRYAARLQAALAARQVRFTTVHLTGKELFALAP